MCPRLAHFPLLKSWAVDFIDSSYDFLVKFINSTIQLTTVKQINLGAVREIGGCESILNESSLY